MEADPDTLLEWLSVPGDMQLMALEQLCMMLLLSDNIDRVFEKYPPKSFLVALARIFLDETATVTILEAAMRAVTFYIDVSADCTRRIVEVEGALAAICNRVESADFSQHDSRDLAMQCMKVLELICSRETPAVFAAGGLRASLSFINRGGALVFKDALHSAMNIVTKLSSRLEPEDGTFLPCVEQLSILLKNPDPSTVLKSLKCFSVLAEKVTRKDVDGGLLAQFGLVEELLALISATSDTLVDTQQDSSLILNVLTLLHSLCISSAKISTKVLHGGLPLALAPHLHHDERVDLECLKLMDLLVLLVFEGRAALPKKPTPKPNSGGLFGIATPVHGRTPPSLADPMFRNIVSAIGSQNFAALSEALDNGFDPNFMDGEGQTLLIWVASFGNVDMAELLLGHGADIELGISPPLHYAAYHGRISMVRCLLRNGADPDGPNADGRSPLDLLVTKENKGNSEIEIMRLLQANEDEWQNEEEGFYFAGDSSLNFMRAFATGKIDLVAPSPGGPGKHPLHPHPLSQMAVGVDLSGFAAHNCDLCGTQTTVEVYRCAQCDFDLCPACFSKGEAAPDDMLKMTLKEKIKKAMLEVHEEKVQLQVSEPSSSSIIAPELSLKDLVQEALPLIAEPSSSSTSAPVPLKEPTMPSSSSGPASTPAPPPPPPVNELEGVDIKEEKESSLVFVSTLLTMLTDAFQSAMVHSVRQGLIASIAKITKYVTPSFLADLFARPSSGLEGSSSLSSRLNELLLAILSSDLGKDLRSPIHLNSLYIIRHLMCKGGPSVAQQLTRLGVVNHIRSLSELEEPAPAPAQLQPAPSSSTPSKYSAPSKYSRPDLPYDEDDSTYRPSLDFIQILGQITAGMRLEAVDRKNPHLTCVATIASVKPFRAAPLLIHFDGWTNTYDYWAHPSSEDLHPIGYCEHPLVNKKLSPPKGHSGPFVWSSYLASVGASAIPPQLLTSPQNSIMKPASLPTFLGTPSFGEPLGLTREPSPFGMMPSSTPFLGGLPPPQPPSELAAQSSNEPVHKKDSVPSLARDILASYFQNAGTDDEVVLALVAIRDRLKAYMASSLVHHHEQDDNVPQPMADGPSPSSISSIFEDLRALFLIESAVSAYELQSSQLASVLLEFLTSRIGSPSLQHAEDLRCFHQIFNFTGSALSTETSTEGGSSDPSASPAALLVRKIVALLEHQERFPVIIYDNSSSANSLQILSRKIKLRLQLWDNDASQSLLNVTNRTLRIEALTSVETLEKYIAKKVVRPWYDLPKESRLYVRALDAGIQPSFAPAEPMSGGILNWIATNGGACPWINPAKHSLISLSCSNSSVSPSVLEHVVDGKDSPLYFCQYANTLDSFIVIDVGLVFLPTHYSMRGDKSSPPPRNWLFEVSTNKEDWVVGFKHENDASIENKEGGCAVWPLPKELSSGSGFRYVRIRMVGPNATEMNTFSFGGIELYGKVLDLPSDSHSNMQSEGGHDTSTLSTSFGGGLSESMPPLQEGMQVKRGPDWKWGKQDGEPPGIGTVLDLSSKGWAEVQWADGSINSYRMGANGAYDLAAVMDEASMLLGKKRELEARMGRLRRQLDRVRGEHEVDDDVDDDESPDEEEDIDDGQDEDALIFQEEELIRQQEELDMRLGSVAHHKGNPYLSFASGSKLDLGPPSHSWDDNTVLTRQISALVPAFDPRPGRTNVQATTDLYIPPALLSPPRIPSSSSLPVSNENNVPPAPPLPSSSSSSSSSKRGSNKADEPDPILLFIREEDTKTKTVVFHLLEPRSTIFAAIQKLNGDNSLKNVWDSTYTLVYASPASDLNPKCALKWEVDHVEKALGDGSLSKGDVLHYLQANADNEWLKSARLVGALRPLTKSRNCKQVTHHYREFALNFDTAAKKPPRIATPSYLADKFEAAPENQGVVTALALLRTLGALVAADHAAKLSQDGPSSRQQGLILTTEVIPLVSMSDFHCTKLVTKLRQQLLDIPIVGCTAFPFWCEYTMKTCPYLYPLDARHSFLASSAFGISRSVVWVQNRLDSAEKARGLRRLDDGSDFKIGRLKHDRVVVPRGDDLLQWAFAIMKTHASSKSVLEIEFQDEPGTGLGPTQEFFSLVASELMRSDLGMWLHDDALGHEAELDLGQGAKPAGYYVRRNGGLFPAPIPPHSAYYEHLIELFRFAGIFVAKSLQDSRLVDLALAVPMVKALFGLPLTLADLFVIDPSSASFLASLKDVILAKGAIMNNASLDETERRAALQALTITLHGTTCTVDSMGLFFIHSPSSRHHGYDEYPLHEGSEEKQLTIDNVEEFFDLKLDFMLNKGVRDQLDAFKSGFNSVFPLSHCFVCTPEEFVVTVCGEQGVKWTCAELLSHMEPKHGFTKESPTFVHLAEVLVAFSNDQRKAFLSFATGCPTLPPGGLANLSPRITVVKKTTDNPDATYPSVNTCVHYLKLPEYSSRDVLKERLLLAITSKGFHLN